MAEKFLVGITGEGDESFEIRREDGVTYVRKEGEDDWRTVDLARVGDSGLYLLMVDNRPTELYIERRRGGALVTIGRHAFDCDVGPWRPASARPKAGAEASGRRNVNAPMTGSVIDVRCKPGDSVEQGDVLLVVESMKMNNEIRAPIAGTVELVQVTPGQRVQQGALLVALQQ